MAGQRRTTSVLLSLALVFVGPAALADEPPEPSWPITPTASPVVPVDSAPCPKPPPVGVPPQSVSPPVNVVARPVYPPEAAHAHGDKVYIALGDSYAAGEGVPVDIRDSCGKTHQLFIAGTSERGNHCHRSRHAYPVRIFEQLEQLGQSWSLDHRACSGAETSNFEEQDVWDKPPWWKFWEDAPGNANPPQWASDPDEGDPADMTTAQPADLVTITMGGNDLGFADIVTDCIIDAATLDGDSGRPGRIFVPDFISNHSPGCRDKWDSIINPKLDDLYTDLYHTFSSVQQHLNKPNGRLIVIGYPRPFPQTPPRWCSVGAGFPIGDMNMRWLNSVADRANEILQAAAHNTGASYVDVSGLYVTPDGQRHDACIDDGSQRWINRTIPSHREWSWHPKAAAHVAQAELIMICYRDATQCDVPSADAASPRPPDPDCENVRICPDLNITDPAWSIPLGVIDELPTYPTESDLVLQALRLSECNPENDGPGLSTGVSEVGLHDLTGDGLVEAVVSLECVPLTSSWPEWVVVLDGAAGPSNPTILDVELTNGCLIGYGEEAPCRAIFRDLEFSFDGNTVTLSGTALSSRAANCCPDLFYEQKFAWEGTDWVAGEAFLTRTTEPAFEPELIEPCAPPNDVPEC